MMMMIIIIELLVMMISVLLLVVTVLLLFIRTKRTIMMVGVFWESVARMLSNHEPDQYQYICCQQHITA